MGNSDDLLREFTERLIRIETLIEAGNKNTKLEIALLEEKIKVANKRIEDLETTQKWGTRTTIGALITGAVGLLFSLTK